MKKIVVSAAVVLMLPSVSSAAMYEYVDRSGRLQIVEATSEQEALVLSDPFVYDSGVKSGTELYAKSNQAFANSLQTSDEDDAHEYRYVSTSGELKTVIASSPSEAMAEAPYRMPSSGVQLVE